MSWGTQRGRAGQGPEGAQTQFAGTSGQLPAQTWSFFEWESVQTFTLHFFQPAPHSTVATILFFPPPGKNLDVWWYAWAVQTPSCHINRSKRFANFWEIYNDLINKVLCYLKLK